MNNIFDKSISDETISRINTLHSESAPIWGKMTVAQMLAHCNVTYEFVYEDKHPKPSGLKKWLLKLLVKNFVVSEKPYKKNTKTAPEFLMKEEKNFEFEKQRLVDYITRTQELGAAYFDGKEYHSFGVMTKQEWNNMFYKHLNHHLNQFGV